MSGKQEKAFRAEVARQIQGMREVNARKKELKNSLDIDPKRLHPRGKLLLLEIDLEGETDGGIIIPGTAQKPTALPVGRVLEAGPEAKDYSAGDLVIVNQRDCGVLDTLLWIAHEEKVLCKVDPKPQRLVELAEAEPA